MTGFYIITGGALLFVAIITVLDQLAQRQRRRQHKG